MDSAFTRLGAMFDCSRNAVLRPETVKEWIDELAPLGYTSLMLYMEDTYEVEEEPFFGYRRGRYTRQELQEIDRYAAAHHMEVIPCIQTLAHLATSLRWDEYAPHVDTGDILLVDDERVYTLIDRMFRSLAASFTGRLVNIGMDEAHMLGRGRYYDQHGDTDRFSILLRHLNRVAAIGKQYGFTLQMWSDMFFRLANGGEYYAEAGDRAAEIRAKIPDNVELIYWDYYSTDRAHYDQMNAAHKQLQESFWFAGGAWSWTGFAPHNVYSIEATRQAFASCRAHGVQNVFLTLWGDDGAECSKWTLLPTLYTAARLAAGEEDEAAIAAGFAERYGLPMADMLALDLPDSCNGTPGRIVDGEKYLLFNDPLAGLLDFSLNGGEGAGFAAAARRLEPHREDARFGYVFDTLYALCRVLEFKAELGVRTRKAYADGDRAAVVALLPDYDETLERLDDFYRAFRTQWYRENKPQGFEVQDARLGGLMLRLKNARQLLADYADGTVERLEELEEPVLPLFGADNVGNGLCFNNWRLGFTAGAMF